MEKINEIFTDQIDDPRDAMRSGLDRDALFELADNIKANGLINPITVRPVADRYEVVAGHRRLSACKIAGIIKIPCVVRELNDEKTFEIMAAENLERADVDPVDEAIFITKFMERTGKTAADVARSVKRSKDWVESRLAIGKMPDYMQHYLKTKQLPIGVALVLNQITDEQVRHIWTDLAVRDGASVAQAEYWLMDWKRQQLPGGTRSEMPPEGYTPGSPRIIEMECAIDGKRYDARQFRSAMIHESNLNVFNAFVTEYRKVPDQNVSSPGGE